MASEKCLEGHLDELFKLYIHKRNTKVSRCYDRCLKYELEKNIRVAVLKFKGTLKGNDNLLKTTANA